MSISIVLLTLIFGLLFILYKRWVRIYAYWKGRGIVHTKPYPFVGNMMDNLLKRKTMGEIFSEITEKFKTEKFIGVYNYITADLIVTDLDDINTVLVKEFSHFTDRVTELKESRFMDKHLFLLTGAEWKGIRAKVSPAFSSGKLKSLFPLMMESYITTADLIDSQLKINKTINIKDIIDMYVVTVSATSIFGIDPNKLTDPNSEFKQVIDDSTNINFIKFLRTTLGVFFPKLAIKLDISPLGPKVEKYMIDLVLNTFKERVESGVARPDIIQQLLYLKQNGKIDINQWVEEDTNDFGSIESHVRDSIEITDSILVSQAFALLVAGSDPLRATLAMLLVELSRNKDKLDKLRNDVNNCCTNHKGMTWQAVRDMDYLDWCLSETLRLYPSLDFISRVCSKDFTFPDGVTVEKGIRVIVPVLKFLKNPNYFPEPEKFIPERFQNPPLLTSYMPFGFGPRICIARRFALQEMKIFIARIIQDYDFSFNSKTQLPIKTDKWYFLRRHTSPIFINFSKRNSTC